jgi:hypothetical protein
LQELRKLNARTRYSAVATHAERSARLNGIDESTLPIQKLHANIVARNHTTKLAGRLKITQCAVEAARLVI